MKDKLITALKIFISLGLMAFLFYLLLSNPKDRDVLFHTLTRANYWYLLLALALYIIAVITNAVKWYILLRAQGIPVPLKTVADYTFVGFFFNNFLPANVGGDIMRGYGLARYIERGAEAAVSVVVDRIIGTLAFMFTAVVAALMVVYILPDREAITNQTLEYVGIVAIMGTIGIAVAFAMMLSLRLRQLMSKLFDIKFLQPLQPLYQRLSDAIGAYRHQYRALLGAFLVGVVTVLLTGLVDVVIVAGIPGEINPIYIFLFNPIIAVALIVPLGIGGLGTMSAYYMFFYGLVEVHRALAFALSLIKQAIIYIGSLPGGALWLRRRGKTSSNSSIPDLEKETDIEKEAFVET